MKNICVLLLSILMLSCSQKKEERTFLTVGVYNMFPPFVYMDEQRGNELTGFDVELAKIIAQKYNKTLRFEMMEFGELIAAVENGDVDIAMSGITITDERKVIVDFSSSYHESSRAAVIRKGELGSFAEITTKEELGQKKRLAAQSGTVGNTIANQIASYSRVIEQPSSELAIIELLNNNADAVIMDKGMATKAVNLSDKLEILPIDFPVEYYGVAIKKGNRELISSINKTIYDIVQSGEYDNLVKEHIYDYFDK